VRSKKGTKWKKKERKGQLHGTDQDKGKRTSGSRGFSRKKKKDDCDKFLVRGGGEQKKEGEGRQRD